MNPNLFTNQLLDSGRLVLLESDETSVDGLSQIEKPGSTPHKATLEKLAKALNVSARQLEE